jgi:hypothetical protein
MLGAGVVAASLPETQSFGAKSTIECTETQPCGVEVSGTYFSNFASITANQNGTDLAVEFEIDTLAFPGLGFTATNVTIRFGESVEIVRTKDHDTSVTTYAEHIDLTGYDIPPGACLTFQAYVEVEDPLSQDDLSGESLDLPESVPMTVSPNGSSGYLTTHIGGDSDLAGDYDAWCVDIGTYIYYNTQYNAQVYSSFDDVVDLGAYVDFPENFDKVNWIINQGFVGQESTSGGYFTSCDVQRAIWTLIDSDLQPNCGTYSQDRINEILAGANADGDGFLPGCGQLVAVVLVPFTQSGTPAQIIVAQTLIVGEAAPCEVMQDSSIIQFCCCLDGDPGCTLTQGYWKTHADEGKPNKYDTTWESVGGSDARFYLSEMTYLEVMQAPSRKGNVYYILAQQYIAAKLNIAAGAWPVVGGAVLEAEAKFLVFTPDQVVDLPAEARADWINLAETLDDFNNGYLGVPHCDD